MTYQTLAHSEYILKASIEIKKSEFISYAYPVKTREQAMFHVEQLRERYPDARHHCWGYIIGDPNNTTSAGFDDDGEPSSTAGRPILNVLQHKNIGNVVIIVIRYFGGIKLGTGGLTRAYSSAAQAVVDHMTLVPYIPVISVNIKTDYANEAQIRYLISDIDGKIDEVNYHNNVLISASIEERTLTQLKDRLGMRGQLVNND